jgi:small nuclear ribonucleoprotein
LEPSKKPLNLLTRRINAEVLIRLKNNAEYRGKMIDCDGHMNIILDGAREYRNNSPTTILGKVVLRGSNILYVCINPLEE